MYFSFVKFQSKTVSLNLVISTNGFLIM